MRKERLTFIEFKAFVDSIVDSCFPNGKYSPEYYDFFKRYYMVSAYVPDYDFGIDEINVDTVNDLYAKVYDDEVTALLEEIITNETFAVQIKTFAKAIDDAIEHRKNLIYKMSAYSETDIALSSLVSKLEELIDKFSNNFNVDDIAPMIETIKSLSKNANISEIAQLLINKISKKDEVI